MGFRIVSDDLPTSPSSRFRIVQQGDGEPVDTPKIRWDDDKTGRISSPALATGRLALESAIPSAGGLGGMATGAVLGSTILPGPGTVVGGILGGLGGSFLTSQLQQTILSALNPEGRATWNTQLQRDRQAHPVASLLGEVLPSMATFRFGIPRSLGTAAVGGALQAGLEAGGELARGEPLSPGRIGTSAGVGALTQPNRLGQRILGLPTSVVGRRTTNRRGQAVIPRPTSSSGEMGAPVITEATSLPRTQPPVPQSSDQTILPSLTRRPMEPPRDLGPSTTVMLPRELSVGSISPTSNKKILQPTENVKSLMLAAIRERPALEVALRETADEVPGATFMRVRVKAGARVAQKAAVYKGAMPDYLGGRLVVRRLEDAEDVLTRLRSRFEIIEDENFFDHPRAGYRARHFQVVLPSGLSAEVQVMTPEMAQAKSAMDVLYAKMRRPAISVAEHDVLVRQLERLGGQAHARYLARIRPQALASVAPERPLFRALPTEVHDVSFANTPTTQNLQVAGSDVIKQQTITALMSGESGALGTQTPALFHRVADGLQTGRIPMPRELLEAGYTREEAAGLYRESATYSGQTLNRLSQIARQLAKDVPELDTPTPPATIWQRVAAAPQRIYNLWRASLVSQLATAVRNITVFHQRYAFKMIEDAISGAYESATKIQRPPQAFGPLLEDLLAYGRAWQRGNRVRVFSLLSAGDDLIKERLIQTPVSETTLGGRYAKLLGTFNNAQEYFARTMVADAVIAGELRRAQATTPTLPMLVKAVDHALDLTVAKAPRSRFGQAFVKAWNHPVLGVLTYPFPRYLTNAVRAIWEHSPPGAISQMLSPKYWAILRSGDPRAAIDVATRAGLGTALFAAASHIRNSEHAGERWYEVRMGGKTLDVRPFGPLLPVYLFLAEALRTGGKNFGPQDWLEGSLGINRMAGTTLFLTSVLAGKNPDTLKRKVAEFAGQFVGGFTVPLRTLQDAAAQFSEEEATMRDVKQAPLTGPARANIPGESQTLPPRFFATQPGVVRREQTGVRQLTGVSLRRKNALESALDRLGIGGWEIEPRTGVRAFDQRITRRMGELATQRASALLESERYHAMSDEEQRDALLGFYQTIRAQAQRDEEQRNPMLGAHLWQRREAQRQTRHRRKVGAQMGQQK